jgi:hypothetical protein
MADTQLLLSADHEHNQHHIFGKYHQHYHQRRVGRPLSWVEGGLVCHLCTYAFITMVLLLAGIGTYVILSTIAQVILGIWSAIHIFLGEMAAAAASSSSSIDQ